MFGVSIPFSMGQVKCTYTKISEVVSLGICHYDYDISKRQARLPFVNPMADEFF